MSTICPSRAHVSLILSKCPTWCRSTFEPCHHDLTSAFVYPSCSFTQENVTSTCAEARFSLEVCTLMEDVLLDIGTLGSYFRSRAFNEAVRPRGSHVEMQPRKSCEKPSDSTRRFATHTHGRKGYMGGQEVFLRSIVSKSSVSTINVSFIIFLCSPLPHVNHGMRFKG
jgi:hypothetical protein